MSDPSIEQIQEELKRAEAQLSEAQKKQKRLRDELCNMAKAQGNLYRFQEKIEQQKIIYAQIAQVGHQFNESLNFHEILQGLDRFLIDLLNFEKFLFFLPEDDNSTLKVKHYGGYHGEEVSAIASLTLNSHHKSLQPLSEKAEPLILISCSDSSPETDELKSLFFMDELILLSLGRKSPQDPSLRGFIAIGNSNENAYIHQRVVRDEELEALFANFIAQIGGALNTLKFMDGIQAESEQVKRLLNNMRQAIFSVDASGTIVEPVSKFSQVLFGTQIVGMNIFDIVFKDIPSSSETHSKLTTAFSTVFGEGELQWELMEEEFPSRLVYNLSTHQNNQEKILKISSRPIWDEKECLEKIMFVVEDITEIERLELQISREREEILVIQEIVKNSIADVKNFFLKSSDSLVECFHQTHSLRVDTEEMGALMRNLHSLKGNARLFSFSLISKKIHESEGLILTIKNKYLQKELSADDAVRWILKELHDIQGVFQLYARVLEKVLLVPNDFQKPILKDLDRLVQELDWRELEKNFETRSQPTRFFLQDLAWTCRSFNTEELLKISEKIENSVIENKSINRSMLSEIRELTLRFLLKNHFYNSWNPNYVHFLELTNSLSLKASDPNPNNDSMSELLKKSLLTAQKNQLRFFTDQIEKILASATSEASDTNWSEIWNYCAIICSLKINQSMNIEQKTSFQQTLKSAPTSNKKGKAHSDLEEMSLRVLSRIPKKQKSIYTQLFLESLQTPYPVREIYDVLCQYGQGEVFLQKLIAALPQHPILARLLQAHFYGDPELDLHSHPQNLYLKVTDCLEAIQPFALFAQNLSQDSIPKMIEIPDTYIFRLGSTIEGLEQNINPESIQKIKSEFKRLFEVPLKPILLKFHTMTEEISDKLGKKVRLEVNGDDVSIHPGKVDDLKDALVHIVRNSLDHGLESPSERRKVQKNEVGLIDIQCFERGHGLELIIVDDGRGIDPDKVAEKALSKKIITPQELHSLTPQQKQELIFRPGFSTKSEANEISGRGMGMDIVRTLVEKMGGTLEIQSRPGLGTEIFIHLKS